MRYRQITTALNEMRAIGACYTSCTSNWYFAEGTNFSVFVTFPLQSPLHSTLLEMEKRIAMGKIDKTSAVELSVGRRFLLALSLGFMVDALTVTIPRTVPTFTSRSRPTPLGCTNIYTGAARRSTALFDTPQEDFARNDTVSSSPSFPQEDLLMNGNLNGNLENGANGSTDNQRKNGQINGQMQPPNNANGSNINNGKSKPKNSDRQQALTAPEINQWTTIMSDGTNAANRNGLMNSLNQQEQEEVERIYNDLKDMSNYDREQVDRYWQTLMPGVSFLGTESVAKIYDALRVAYRAHRGQMRKSGEPFIIHPVEVALLLTGLKMDAETIMAGLLHDTVEDTDLTFGQVEAMFGQPVRALVEGETKVSKLPKLAFTDYADEQAENLRQMFVAMTDDYRIIIVKLADRLHNMRTLRHMKPEKQVKISRETLDIFAPLAHRMGIWQFKSELEDTAFMYLYPKEYKQVNRLLRIHQTKFRETLDKSQEVLSKTLEKDPTLKDRATVHVFGRTKELYSLWHKMETKGEHNLDRIMDVVALRVILTPNLNSDEIEEPENEADRGVWLCYHVLGLVQHLPGFQPMPTRVKDYISFPKPNGYQSLHTALMLNGQTIEVQIRTSTMHQVAEYGMASHWAYTDSKKRPNMVDTGPYNTPWLSSIKEWQDDVVCSRDFVDSVRSELLGKRVFVFLRNGKILNLARGATAIDAAFQIHTEVGLKMHGAEINGNPVPFSYELQNGDVVSILTGEGKPATDWMRYAKSRSTRSKLRSYFRQKQKESLQEAGKILIMDYLWIHGPLIETKSFLDAKFQVPTTVEELAKMLPEGKTSIKNVDELLLDIGKKHDRMYLHTVVSGIFLVPLAILVEAESKKGLQIPITVFAAVHESRRMAKDAARAAATESTKPAGLSIVGAIAELPLNETGVLLSDDDNEKVMYADHEHICQECLPVLGDEIIGTSPTMDGEINYDDAVITVHRVGCSHAQQAINRGMASKKVAKKSRTDSYNYLSRVDSVKLRGQAENRFTSRNGSTNQIEELPLKLRWPEDSDYEDDKAMFLAEVVVVAEDRKLLLSDCSEIVSEMSEMLKTSSSSSEEHAILDFLFKVSNLEDLQILMDSLSQIPSVMSVERRFGTVLL